MKKYFEKGISMISLIITIIVIIILAAIVIFTGLGTPERANFAQFSSDLSGLQEVVWQKYGERYADLSVRNMICRNEDIYRWIAVGNSLTTTTGVQSVSPTEGTNIYGVTLTNVDKNGNEILWYVKILSDTEKKAIEIDDDKNQLGMKLPKYEDKTWKIRLSDGIIFIDPPYEYEGKQYVSIQDLNNGGGVYAANSNEYVDILPNAPILRNGMIPVYYDESAKIWKKADSSNDGNTWYDYANKKWANMVTVSSEKYKSASVGTEVKEEDILGYWVWIPRYAYKLEPSTQTIDAVFLAGKGDKFADKTVGEGNDYKIHPAFTSDTSIGGWSSELEGIWVAKFEASNSETVLEDDYTGKSTVNIAGQDVNVTVVGTGKISNSVSILNLGKGNGFAVFKPNLNSWRKTAITDVYLASRNVANYHGVNADSHLIKNSEWGAIAYLSKSQYGLGATDIYANSYFEGEGTATTQTGMSGTTASDSNSDTLVKSKKTYGTDGTITIEYKKADTGEDAGTKTFYMYDTLEGRRASTTGNIYGIYDMSGGAGEYIASVIDNDNHYSLNLFKGINYTDEYITKYPKSEVQDYPSNNREDNPIYGDGTTEIFILQNKNWYSDGAGFPYLSIPWFVRGGNFTKGNGAGLFAYDGDYGTGLYNGYYKVGFRAVLIP